MASPAIIAAIINSLKKANEYRQEKFEKYNINGTAIILYFSTIVFTGILFFAYGDYQFDRGYEEGRKNLEQELLKKEIQQKEEFKKISEDVNKKTLEFVKEQAAQIEKQIVYVDKIIEKDKPIYIRECISDDAVEFLNSKGVVK